MQVLIQEPTNITPFVHLDSAKRTFIIEGTSIPENETKFFKPVIDWFNEYVTNPNDVTEVTFKMDYFNTFSSKKILDILTQLEELSNKKNKKVIINWMYRDGDEDMKEAGEEFEAIVNLEFKIAPFH